MTSGAQRTAFYNRVAGVLIGLEVYPIDVAERKSNEIVEAWSRYLKGKGTNDEENLVAAKLMWQRIEKSLNTLPCVLRAIKTIAWSSAE